MKISLTSLYNWYRNSIRNPKYRWWIILGTIVYLISPFDISPDFIPIVGELDDFVLVSLLVTEISQFALEKYKSRKQPQTAASNETVDVKAETVSSSTKES